jgi:hypothetical protein
MESNGLDSRSTTARKRRRPRLLDSDQTAWGLSPALPMWRVFQKRLPPSKRHDR